MAQEEKEYSVVKEAEDIIERLAKAYPDILWTVTPANVVVLGVTNKERPSKMNRLAQIRSITGVTKALLEEYRVGKKYIIELYWNDWNVWSPARREWVLFHELVHIPSPTEKGLVKHDVQDFSGIVNYFGEACWWQKETLPSLLDGEPIKFDPKLFQKLHVKEDEDGEEDGDQV